MTIEITNLDDICNVSVQGRLVAGMDSDDLEAKLVEIKNLKPGKLLVDVSEVTSIGSTGVGFLMNLYASTVRNPQGRFVLVGAGPRVRQVLDVTRLSKVISLAPDATSGQAILRGASPAPDSPVEI
jgi:anti-anti-sigma factor